MEDLKKVLLFPQTRSKTCGLALCHIQTTQDLRTLQMGRDLERSGPTSCRKGSPNENINTPSSCILKTFCGEDTTTALQGLHQ